MRKSLTVIAYMMGAGALLNASAVTIMACGHTKKHNIACPATERKCDGTGGQSQLNCTVRKYRTQQLSADFGSEGCGECNSEAVAGVVSAVCEKLKGCKLFGVSCVINTASAETTDTRTVVIDVPCG